MEIFAFGVIDTSMNLHEYRFSMLLGSSHFLFQFLVIHNGATGKDCLMSAAGNGWL